MTKVCCVNKIVLGSGWNALSNLEFCFLENAALCQLQAPLLLICEAKMWRYKHFVQSDGTLNNFAALRKAEMNCGPCIQRGQRVKKHWKVP